MNPRIIDTKYEGKTSTGEKAELHVPMRELWSTEISDFYNRGAENADKPIEERKVLQYQILLDAAASWAASVPFIKVGDNETCIDEADTLPADTIREYFKEPTPKNDWILNSLINQVITESSNETPVF